MSCDKLSLIYASRIVDKYKNKELLVGNLDYPLLIYQDEVRNASNKFEGLLRNEILIKVM